MATISRSEYVNLFGPTVGDRIRLGDTGLFVEIERDLRGRYGDEIVFGGGKSLREGMGMDNRLTRKAGAPDLVITNVTIIDAVQGVVKADVGVKDGLICGIGANTPLSRAVSRNNRLNVVMPPSKWAVTTCGHNLSVTVHIPNAA